MGILGCMALAANATPSYPEEMAAGTGDDDRILTINFIGERSASVAVYYRVYGKGTGTRSALILMESLKRKLAEKGFERRNGEDAGEESLHGYSVFIMTDTGYVKATRALEKRPGDLTAIIVQNEKVAAVNTAPAKGREMAYRQIEKLADDIVSRLLLHSYI